MNKLWSICIALIMLETGFDVRGEEKVKRPSEEDLMRKPALRIRTFPWVEAAVEARPQFATNKVEPEQGTKKDDSDLFAFDLSKLYIQLYGQITRSINEREKTEVLTLNKDVAIELPGANSAVLRAQSIALSRSTETGEIDKLEARGDVQMRREGMAARGEYLLYETKKASDGRVLYNRVTIEGNRDERKPATLFLNQSDAIQAYKFILDLEAVTFRAVAGARAEFEMPNFATPQSDTEDAKLKTISAGMMPGLSLSSGSKILLTCDGDLSYDSSTGKVQIRRNVRVTRPGFALTADEMAIQLQTSDEATRTARLTGEDASLFTGKPKTLECSGRVEIFTPVPVIHCDKIRYDLRLNLLYIEMEKPDEQVNIYWRDQAYPQERMALSRLVTPNKVMIDTQAESIKSVDGSPGAFAIKSFVGEIPRLRPERDSRFGN